MVPTCALSSPSASSGGTQAHSRSCWCEPRSSSGHAPGAERRCEACPSTARGRAEHEAWSARAHTARQQVPSTPKWLTSTKLPSWLGARPCYPAALALPQLWRRLTAPQRPPRRRLRAEPRATPSEVCGSEPCPHLAPAGCVRSTCGSLWPSGTGAPQAGSWRPSASLWMPPLRASSATRLVGSSIPAWSTSARRQVPRRAPSAWESCGGGWLRSAWWMPAARPCNRCASPRGSSASPSLAGQMAWSTFAHNWRRAFRPATCPWL